LWGEGRGEYPEGKKTHRQAGKGIKNRYVEGIDLNKQKKERDRFGIITSAPGHPLEGIIKKGVM